MLMGWRVFVVVNKVEVNGAEERRETLMALQQ
jgi:hypothetical protein